jgi:glutamyl/glutaminyl-tRNA synthetase
MISRFNPTTNGPLHIGHIYSVLVIMAESDSMLLRFDDNQRYWIEKLGYNAMQQIAATQLRDLLWMGLEPDSVSYNSQMEEMTLAELAACSHFRVVQDFSPCNPETKPVIRARIEPWGASSWLVAEKVVLDHMQHISVLVRGLELLQENSLYMYLCGIFGYKIPGKMVYIPRLMAGDGRELTDVSKTRGDWKVCDLRSRGVTPERILGALRASCLVDPGGPFLARNIKYNPVLKEEMLS